MIKTMFDIFKIFVLAISISLFSPAQPVRAHGNVIGNGGNAFDFGDRLILRDLYEIAGERKPYFGSETSPRFLQLAQNIAIFQSRASDERPAVALVAAKLLDLNRVSPTLGDYLASTILNLRFVLIDDQLPLISDFDTQFGLPSNGKLIAVANRTRRLVRINRESWHRLGEKGRIALLFHEAVGALVVKSCSSQLCRQSAVMTRELTGLMFTREGVSPQTHWLPMLVPQLAIPDENFAPIQHSPQWTVSTRSGGVERQISAEFFAADPTDFNGFIAQACGIGFESGSEIEVTSRIEALPFTVEREEYDAGDAPQEAIFIRARKDKQNLDGLVVSTETWHDSRRSSCEHRLQHQLRAQLRSSSSSAVL